MTPAGLIRAGVICLLVPATSKVYCQRCGKQFTPETQATGLSSPFHREPAE
jgi:hypothetical protein